MISTASINRPTGRTRGGWIADAVDLRKCITLCNNCDHIFNPRKLKYELWRRDFGTTGPYVISDCWGCERKWVKCKAFIHESTHDLAGEDSKPRRRGRWQRT